jgi:predicted dinucleotide-binding enzyme
MNKEEVFETKERVAVIGTGNYGIAIGKRLLDYGYDVVFGSRTPNKNYLEECLNTNSFEVAKISEAFYKSDKFVFLALSAKNYEQFVNEINLNENETSLNDSNFVVDLKKSKIIIELSNLSDEKNEQISNAEKLENLIKYNTVTKNDNLLSNIRIVKGFNLVNAYTMSANYSEKKGNTETIPIAGNDKVSKEEIIKLANRIGFQGIDIGPLKNSLQLELSNIKTFNEWHYPIILTALFVLFNLIWVFFWYYFFPKKPHTFEQFIVKFSPLEHLNKVLGFSSLQILAFVYLASIIAGIYQLKNGTKYKRFPKYLDYWLKTRKQVFFLLFN